MICGEKTTPFKSAASTDSATEACGVRITPCVSRCRVGRLEGHHQADPRRISTRARRMAPTPCRGDDVLVHGRSQMIENAPFIDLDEPIRGAGEAGLGVRRERSEERRV